MDEMQVHRVESGRAGPETDERKQGAMMMNYNTSIYDNLPVSVILYEVMRDADGAFEDYRIIYGNRAFARDYKMFYGREDYIGVQAVRDHLIDDYTLFQMKSYLAGTPKPFSTFIPHANLHVHMEPLLDLPEGYVGYVITNIKDFEEQESRVYFLHAISQMNNIACLFQQHEDGSFSTVYVTPAFCDMMECDSREDALKPWMEMACCTPPTRRTGPRSMGCSKTAGARTARRT